MGGIAWTEEEDELLKKYIEQFGEGKWHRLPILAGINRCSKSCRMRWVNYLSPKIRRGSFEEDEVELIIKLHKLLGNRWSLIAGRLAGRTGNDVKNYWNCHLSKKLDAQANKEKQKSITKVQVIRPQPRYTATTTAKTVLRPVCPEPTNLKPMQELEDEHGGQVLLEEEISNEEDGVMGDLAVQFDLEQVTVTNYQLSGNKWVWDDLVLDMDI